MELFIYLFMLISGNVDLTNQTTNSDSTAATEVLKTKHDTAKNTISN